MAYKFVFKQKGKLPFMWNISAKVGNSEESKNNPTDVELVAFLLDFAFKIPVSKAPIHKISTPIVIDGDYEIIKGYWLYHFQAFRHSLFGAKAIVDGRVSPAKRFDVALYTIAHLNNLLFTYGKDTFFNLDKKSSLTVALKNELSVDMSF